jgi:3-hydroxyisobutyrate dehydrogenase
LGIQVAAVAELAAMLEAHHVELGHALEIINSTPVASPAMRGAANSIQAKAFAPLFPVELAEKDLGYAEAARPGGLPITSTTRAVMKQAILAGYGKDHLTGIARLY